MLKISNFHVFQMFGSTEGLPIPYRGRSAKKKEKSSDSLALTGTLESQHTLLYCWSPAALYVFSAEQVREEGEKKVPAPAINREPQHHWFMMLAALVASSNTAWLESPHILIFHPPTPATDLAFPSSLITSFSDLHLLFQSWFPGPFFISPAISSFHKSCRCF